MSPDLEPTVPCRHPDSEAEVRVVGLIDDSSAPEGTPPDRWSAEVTVRCASCLVPFEWIGPMGLGMSPMSPTVSADRLELRCPIRPSTEAGQPVKPGVGFTGRVVNIEGGEPPKRPN